jgi:hypothetical protein
MTHRVAPRSAGAILCALALGAAAFVALWLSRAPAPELPFTGGGGEFSAERAYGELPLAFEPGARGGIDYVSHSASGTLALWEEGATLALGRGNRPESIGLDLVGATPAEPRALDRLPGVVNDLRGDDPARWRTGIRTFERVSYPGVWPGIGLDWYGDQGRLEYDLRLAPGANPDRIAFRIAGADRLRLASNGDLLITADTETIRQRAPVAYQPATKESTRTPVGSAFALSGDTVRFRLGAYDRNRPLVIDPLVLAYSTRLGSAPGGRAIAVDSSGAAYVAGHAGVSKLNPAGNALVYSTLVGGSQFNSSNGIAVDSTGAAYVTGSTDSTDFPTVNAIEGDSPNRDAFVYKLNPAGNALVYSTYLGGDEFDDGFGIAVDSTGAAYVTGRAGANFNTVGEIEGHSGMSDAFVAKLTPAGNALEYSTYLGGASVDWGNGIVTDSSGAAYVTGRTESSDFNTVGEIEGESGTGDVFISKLSPAGSALEYSTYLGAGNFEEGSAIAVDSAGAAYITGRTQSGQFDTVGAIEGDSRNMDAFIAKLTPAGSALVYSTYLGGNGVDEGHGIAVDSSGAAYVTGLAGSDFNTVDPIGGDPPGNEAFVSKLIPDGSALEYSTHLGGNGFDTGSGIAVDVSGDAYVTGRTGSTDFPTVGAIDTEGSAFVSKLMFCTIAGTPGNDTLIGTPGADIICGLGGDDTINANEAEDVLLGGDGDDVLLGSTGDDILDGGPGQDRAGYSTDATGGISLSLETGVVTSANLGTDTIVQEAGVSTIEQAGGTEFADALVGDGRDNLLEGGAGDDTIVGRGGADLLVGAAGEDELAGGKGGADKLDPGTGDDPMVSGGAGSDTVRYRNVNGGGVAIDLAAGIASPLGGGNSGTDTLDADIENAIGSLGDDELRAQLAGIASVLEGADGADSLDTSDGDTLDTANGGTGADTCATDGGDKRSSCP